MLLALLPATSQATPQIIRVDGSIFDNSGVPVTASKDIEIKAYDAASGGSLLWTSSVYNTVVTTGKFTINLDAAAGSTPSLVDRFGERTASQAIYFQIEVDSGAANGSMNTPTIVLPRMRARGTAFALSANSADTLKGVTATTAEMNFLTGVSANVQTQINAVNGTASGVSAKVSKTGDSMSGALQIGANITSTGTVQAATLNSTSATASRFALFDSSKNLTSSVTTVTDTEFGFLSGVTANLGANLNGLTANVQTQLNGKQSSLGYTSLNQAGDTMTGGLGLNYAGATPSRFLMIDAARKMVTSASAVTDTEFGYLAGATQAIQTQLNARVTQTTSAMSIYVRTDGDDSLCNGSVNVAYSVGVAPSCAFASPTKGAIAVPMIVLNAVTVNIAAGTYYSTTSGATMMDFSNLVGPNGSIYVVGNGGTPVLSGAASGAPTTPLAAYGIFAINTRDISLSGLQLEYFAGGGVVMSEGAGASINNLTSSNNTGFGLICYRATCSIGGASTANSNGTGLFIFMGGSADVSGVFTANSNAQYGISSQFGALTIGSGGTITANSNMYGIGLTSGSTLSSLGGITASSNTGAGIQMERSTATFSGSVTLNGDVMGVLATNSSVASFYSTLTALNNTYGLYLSSNASVFTNDDVTISGAGTVGDLGIFVSRKSSLNLNPGTSKAVSISRASNGGAVGIYAEYSSDVSTGGAGSITIDKFATGITAVVQSTIWGDSAGTRTISNATNDTNITSKSLYGRGGFVAGTCDASSTCQ